MKSDKQLLPNLVHIIEQGKKKVAVTVNSAVVLTYWQVGKAINEHILKNERAEYGKEIVATVSLQLVDKYGKSFELRNLRRMMQGFSVINLKYCRLFYNYQPLRPRLEDEVKTEICPQAEDELNHFENNELYQQFRRIPWDM